MRAVLIVFSCVFSFCKFQILDSASGIWLPYCFRLAINWENYNDATIFDMTSLSIFWRCFVSVVKFNYWSNFHVNIYWFWNYDNLFYKGLTRNHEIGNPIWVLPNIWRLGQVRNNKFGKNVSNKMLLDASKSQGYGFWVIKEKPTGGEVKLPPPRLGLKIPKQFCCRNYIIKKLLPRRYLWEWNRIFNASEKFNKSKL